MGVAIKKVPIKAKCANYTCNHTLEDDGREVCALLCECGGTAVEPYGKCEGCAK